MVSRDQRRALRAYEWVRSSRDDLTPDARKAYAALIRALGANIMRSGLAAAMSWLERRQAGGPGVYLLNQLAGFDVPGIRRGADGAGLPAAVRALPVEEYMLSTQEFLRVAIWLRRALQADATMHTGAGSGPQAGIVA